MGEKIPSRYIDSVKLTSKDWSGIVTSAANSNSLTKTGATKREVPWEFCEEQELILHELVKPFGGFFVKSDYFNADEHYSGEKMQLYFSTEQADRGEDADVWLIKRPRSKAEALYIISNHQDNFSLEMNMFANVTEHLVKLLPRLRPVPNSAPALNL